MARALHPDGRRQTAPDKPGAPFWPGWLGFRDPQVSVVLTRRHATLNLAFLRSGRCVSSSRPSPTSLAGKQASRQTPIALIFSIGLDCRAELSKGGDACDLHGLLESTEQQCQTADNCIVKGPIFFGPARPLVHHRPVPSARALSEQGNAGIVSLSKPAIQKYPRAEFQSVRVC